MLGCSQGLLENTRQDRSPSSAAWKLDQRIPVKSRWLTKASAAHVTRNIHQHILKRTYFDTVLL